MNIKSKITIGLMALILLASPLVGQAAASVLQSFQGGTGTSTALANQLLIGNPSGTGWTEIATSSLGISGGGGSSFSTTSINGFATTSFSFITGTAGSDFTIATSSSAVTFNLPTASASNRGVLSSADWTTFNNKGSVSSVGMTTPTGLSISGSPVTTSGTLALSLSAGYVIPLTASTTQWANLVNASTTLPYVTSVAATVPTGLSIAGSPITTSGTLAFSLQSGYNIPLTASTTQWANLVNGSTTLPYLAASGGTKGFVATWASSTALTTGALIDNGTVAGIGATSSGYMFNVQGTGATRNLLNLATSTGASMFSVDNSGNVIANGSVSFPAQMQCTGGIFCQLQSNGTDIDIKTTNSSNSVVFTVNTTDILKASNYGITLGGGTPTMGTCGTSPSVSGNDNVGIVTVGSGVVTSCTVNFGTTKTGTPHVFITVDGATAIANSISSETTSGFTANFAATLGGGKFDYLIMQN